MKALKALKAMKAMNRKDIEDWLRKYNITNYTIHPNLVVDVDGDVDLLNKMLKILPFRFGHVTGYFKCSHNKLPSLLHCPTSVGGDFHCFNNPRFEVTSSNEGSWIRVIKAHKDVYEQIKHIATDRMTATYEMRWIP